MGLPLNCEGGWIEQGAWLAPRQFVQNAFSFLEKQGVIIKTSQKITALSQQEKGWELKKICKVKNTAMKSSFLRTDIKLLILFKQKSYRSTYPRASQSNSNIRKLTQTEICALL